MTRRSLFTTIAAIFHKPKFNLSETKIAVLDNSSKELVRQVMYNGLPSKYFIITETSYKPQDIYKEIIQAARTKRHLES